MAERDPLLARSLRALLAPVLAWARRESLVALPVIGALPGPAMRAWSEEGTLPLDIPTDAPTPRHADALVVVGRVSHKAAPVLLRLHAEMARPCVVLAIDAEPGFARVPLAYGCVPRVEEILPVDVVVRGAPPRPETLARGLAALAAIRAGRAP